MRRTVAAILLSILASGSMAQLQLPSPTISHKECNSEEFESQRKWLDEDETLLRCFSFINKWNLEGTALVVERKLESKAYPDIEAFKQLRRKVYLAETAELRRTRDPSENAEGVPPAHMSVPRSLDVTKPVAIGVFANEESYIGSLWIKPNTPKQRPSSDKGEVSGKAIMYLQTNGKVLLLQIDALVTGANIIREFYTITEEWAQLILSSNK